jgi:hypothetical protein
MKQNSQCEKNSCKFWFLYKEVKGWEGQCLKFLISLSKDTQNLMEIMNRLYTWGQLDLFWVDVEAINLLFLEIFLVKLFFAILKIAINTYYIFKR